MTQKVIVIGGGAGGMAAAAKAKRTNPSLDVAVFEAKGHVAHAPCGTPYYLGGYFDEFEHLVHYPVDLFVKKRGINVYLNSPVIRVDIDNKVVTARVNDAEEEFEFDYLVLAMGAKPRRLNVEGEDLENIFFVRHIDDVPPIRKALDKAENIILIGAGFISVEMAEAFTRQKKKVTIITHGKQVLSRLDLDMSELLEKTLLEKGVNVRKEENVVAFEGNDKVKKVVTDKGEYLADIVLVSIGIEPFTDLVKNSKLEFGYKGTIKVNSRMQTNIDYVYAVGDIAEMKDVVTGKPTWYPLAQIANKMGRVAGSNIGGVPMDFDGVAGTTFLKFYDTAVGITGLNTEIAIEEGFNAKSVRIEANDRPAYYPDPRKLVLKIIYDLDTRRILGGQALGSPTITGRINVLATALYAKLKIDDLYQVDFGYAPPFAPVWDPLVVASSVSMRDYQKKKK